MAATKRERLNEVIKRLVAGSPFRSGHAARMALEEIMKAVEDELSGVPENLNAGTTIVTDGRMYPPGDGFEFLTGSSRVRAFRQLHHSTWIGENGALRIVRIDRTVEIDLAGADGKTVTDLLSESNHELH